MNYLFLNDMLLLDTGGTMTKLLQTVGTIGGALVAIALIFSIVRDAMGYIKGTGSNSVGKIIGKVIFLIVMLGIIGLSVNYSTKLKGTGENMGEKGVKVVNEFTNDITTSP